MSGASPDSTFASVDAGLHDLSAQRLRRRYRWLLGWVAAPVLLLLVLLAAWQARTGWLAAVADFERGAVQPHAELQSLVHALAEHVADLRQGLEADLLSTPRTPDAALRDWLTPHPRGGFTLDEAPSLTRPGLAQLLWPGDTPPDDAVLWRLQSLSQLAERAHGRNADLALSFHGAWPQRQWLLYPWLPSAQALSAAPDAGIDALLALRYGTEPFISGTPERNPQRTPYWVGPLPGPGGSTHALAHAAPVYVGDDFRGVVGAQVRLSALVRLLESLGTPGTRWWLLDEQGTALLAGGPAEQDAVPPSPTVVDDARAHPGQARVASHGRVLALPVSPSPWLLVVTVGDAELARRMLPGLLPFVVLGLALVAMFMGAQFLLRRRVIEPALTIMGYLHARAIDERTPEPTLSERWQPWARVVTLTFEARTQARARERRSEAFKSAVVDQALAAIVTVDGQARVVEWNAAAEAMFGWPRSAAVGRPVADFIAPRHQADAHAKGLMQVAGRRVEISARRADGSLFPIEMQVTRIEVDGEPYYSAFVVDISARVAAAAEIERQREALRQSEKLGAMGGLLAGVAHELNNPLAIVLGRAALLEAKTEGTDAADDARRIRDAAERCGRIVRSFLNMARSRPAQLKPVQLNDLVRAALDLLAYTLRTGGVTVEPLLADELPPVLGDEDRLGQLLMNLVVNAQHALATQPAPRRLRVETGSSDDSVWLRVCDSGPGIAPDDAERVFAPYYTTKGEGVGTGLGLAVSRSVAREHGGELLLETVRPLGGASFRLALPLATAAAPTTIAQVKAADDDAPTLRVLVVDDEPDFADMLRETLEQAGYEVATAESGAVALELLAEARFDAIVSDLRMPDMDGLALWQAVQQRAPSLARRLLFVTGDTLSANARAVLGSTGCDALDKPFDPAELLRRIRTLATADEPPAA